MLGSPGRLSSGPAMTIGSVTVRAIGARLPAWLGADSQRSTCCGLNVFPDARRIIVSQSDLVLTVTNGTDPTIKPGFPSTAPWECYAQYYLQSL